MMREQRLREVYPYDTRHDTLGVPATRMRKARHQGRRIFTAMALVDQSLQTLLQLQDLDRVPRLPRSPMLEAVELKHRMDSNGRGTPSLKTFGSAAILLMHLGRQWKHSMNTHNQRRSLRYYQLVSLAAATVFIPWLLLKRDEMFD